MKNLLKNANIKIRDLRRKEKYQVDDEYLNIYARLCGWQATLVYNSLCRHSNKDQYSFPSVDLMAEQHGVSRNTILKGLKSLEEWKIIQVVRTSGKTNGYILLDKDEWLSKQVYDSNQFTTRTTTSSPQGLLPVHHKDSKDTHIKDINTNVLIDESLKRDKKDSFGNEKVNFLLEEFRKRWGEPSDSKPPVRYTAWNMARMIDKFISEQGKEPTLVNFSRAVDVFYASVHEKEYSSNIEKIFTLSGKLRRFLYDLRQEGNNERN